MPSSPYKNGRLFLSICLRTLCQTSRVSRSIFSHRRPMGRWSFRVSLHHLFISDEPLTPVYDRWLLQDVDKQNPWLSANIIYIFHFLVLYLRNKETISANDLFRDKTLVLFDLTVYTYKRGWLILRGCFWRDDEVSFRPTQILV